MADFVSPIVQFGSCLWNTVANRTVHIRNLKNNLESLEVAMEQLKQVYEDVKERVGSEEKQLRKRTNEVAGWLDRVQSMEAEVREILQEGKEEEQKKCLGGCCPKNCWSTYKVGERVSKMLNDVDKLRKGGGFNVVTREVVRANVNEKRTGKTVGLDLMLEQVWGCIEDTDLRIIGLYGLGGVGKTTLLKKINNEFLKRRHGFEYVIWVSVSKEPDLKKIQDALQEELQISDRSWKSKSTDKRAETIYSILKEKKFVLLLDDIWKRLDLVELGVLNHDQDMQKGSKVVFTTRSQDICGQMEAQRKIKVECLTPEVALDLFRTKVSEDTLNSHPRISELAEIMAARCKGLPLALVTIGLAMASRTKPEEWEQDISILRNSDPSQLPGMNDVLLLLKFSFDRLENTTLKSCFLYCSIFPEGYNIRKEELIQLWLGAGLILYDFVDGFGGLSNARKKGESIIGSLKRACLLETGESEEFVTMHQMIRDMALCEWREKIKIYVKQDPLSIQVYGSGSWNETEMISLWDHGMEAMNSKDLQLLKVRTLICKLPLLTTFPIGFFHSMPALTVLDLSNSFLLRELPAEIGELINLQYLNLSETAISELPNALGNLKKLRCLLLPSQTYHPRLKIPREMISNFQLLEVFSTSYCDEDLLDELEHLQYLSEISIEISDYASITRLLRSHKLQECLKKLNFRCDYGLPSIEVSPSLLRRMEHLELNSRSLQEFKISSEGHKSIHRHHFDNLCRVVIKSCPMSDATWLIYARRLQHLTLTDCEFMKEVIGDTSGEPKTEENADLFSSLTALHLEYLPVLEGICRPALPFPFLMKICVMECPSLKKLPFDSNSAKNNLKQINGGRSWWDELHWEDEAIKQVFTSKFEENPYER